MKKFLVVFGLVATLVGGVVLHAQDSSPWPDWFNNYLKFSEINDVGAGYKRIAHGNYTFANQGAGTVGTAIYLGTTLPANALVSRAWYFANTALAATNAQFNNTNTMQMGCGTGAHFKAAANLIGATVTGGFVEAIQTGSAATMTSSSTTCAVSISVASHPLTAGDVDFYIEYAVPL